MIYNYIIVEGNIGAGKTTLSNMLAEKYDARLILEEFADNPFLPKFYKNRERFAFPLELSFLAERYNQLNKELSSLDLFHKKTVSDYYFMKSMIFAKQTLASDEYKLYQQIFSIMHSNLPKPDLFIYLHNSVDNLLKNIDKRGREYEKDIDPDYLKTIEKGYFEFLKQHPDMKILIIDCNNLDFVNNTEHFQQIIDQLNIMHQNGINRVILPNN
jgi:deoxyadenosine/deoxycytidine kinase